MILMCKYHNVITDFQHKNKYSTHIVSLGFVVGSRHYWINVVLNEGTAFGFRGQGAQSLNRVLHSSSSYHEYQKDNHQNDDYNQTTCKFKIMWLIQSYCYIINCAEQKCFIPMLCKLRSLHVKRRIKLQIDLIKTLKCYCYYISQKHTIVN